MSSQFLTVLFGKIFGAIASIALIRYLGAERQGIYSYILSVVYIFGFFSDFGINKFLTREVRISGEKGREIFGNGLFVQIIQVLLSILLVNIYVFVFELNEGIRNELLLASVVLNLGYLTHPFIAVLNSYEKMYFSGLATALTSIFNAILIFFAIYLKLPITGIFIILGISNTLNIIMSAVLSIRFTIRPLFDIKWEKIKFIIRGCLPFVAIGLFSSFYAKVDVLILYKMKPAAEVGYYTAPLKIIEMLIALLSMIALPFYPRLSYIINKKSKEEAIRVINLSIKYLIGLVAPFALMVTMFNYDYTMLLFGEEFIKSRYAFAVIIWAIFVMSMFSIGTHALNAARLSRFIVYFYAAAGIIDVILNVIFIPKYSYLATSVILIITNLFIALCVLITVSRKIGRISLGGTLTKLIISLLPVFIFWYFTEGKSGYIVLSIAGIIIYGISVFATRYIDSNDIRKLKSIFAKAES